MSAPVTRISWQQTHRLVAAQYPVVDLYDDIADPADWELLTRAAGRTNPRRAPDTGDLSLVPVNKRRSGPGAGALMAAFVYASPDRPSRFTDGSFGIYYAGESIETALHEYCFHRARFHATTRTPPDWIGKMRQMIAPINSDLIDIRGGGYEELLDRNPERYAASQKFGRMQRAADANGIVYPSLRNPGGTCIAAFWPVVMGLPVQGDHYEYYWNGETITHVKLRSGGRKLYQISFED